MTAKADHHFSDLPELPGYMSIAEAAKLFGLTRQGIYYRAFTAKKFGTVYRVGGGTDSGERPFLLLARAEVDRVLREEAQQVAHQAALVTPEERLNAFHRRVKEWGLWSNWTRTRISTKGRPHHELVAAYEQAHPNDRRPV